jgi:MFS family permease
MLVFPAVVLPLMVELDMEMGSVLAMSFWMYFLFGVTALPWGVVADKWRADKLLRIFYAGAGMSGLAAGIWIDAPNFFILSLAGIGLFSGIYHPAGLGLISKEIKRISLGMGFNGMFGNLGLASAPLLAGLVNWIWGPRAAYFLLGGLNLCGLLLSVFFPMLKEETRKVPVADEGNGLIQAFLILLVAMMLGGVVYRGATVILPAVFELRSQALFLGVSNLVQGVISENLLANTITSVIFLIGMLGQYTGGRMAERFDLRYAYLIFHAMTIPMAIFLGLTSDYLLVLLAVIYFFFLLGMQPIENTLVAKYTPKKLHHSAYGFKFVLTFGVGAVAVKMVEKIEKNYGIEPIYPVLGIISLLLVAVIGLLIYHTRNTHPKRSITLKQQIR